MIQTKSVTFLGMTFLAYLIGKKKSSQNSISTKKYILFKFKIKIFRKKKVIACRPSLQEMLKEILYSGEA